MAKEIIVTLADGSTDTYSVDEGHTVDTVSNTATVADQNGVVATYGPGEFTEVRIVTL